KQLEAVENLFLVPHRAIEAEADADTILARHGPDRRRAQRRLLRPLAQPRLDLARQNIRTAFAPVLPREVLLPAPPRAVLKIARVPPLGEREIADRNHMQRGIVGLRVPAAVAERVELFDVAEAEPRLLLHPGAQTALE